MYVLLNAARVNRYRNLAIQDYFIPAMIKSNLDTELIHRREMQS